MHQACTVHWIAVHRVKTQTLRNMIHLYLAKYFVNDSANLAGFLYILQSQANEFFEN